MHHNTVAVESELTMIKEALEGQGIATVDMSQISTASCVVTSGMDQNFMGMADIEQDIPVIIAKGKTPDEVVNDVKRFLK
jgi:predicted Fe-Mo cluster-binding NifX family protein